MGATALCLHHGKTVARHRIGGVSLPTSHEPDLGVEATLGRGFVGSLLFGLAWALWLGCLGPARLFGTAAVLWFSFTVAFFIGGLGHRGMALAGICLAGALASPIDVAMLPGTDGFDVIPFAFPCGFTGLEPKWSVVW